MRTLGTGLVTDEVKDRVSAYLLSSSSDSGRGGAGSSDTTEEGGGGGVELRDGRMQRPRDEERGEKVLRW